MAVVFSTTFNDALAAWDANDGAQVVNGAGIADAFGVTCCSSGTGDEGSLEKNLTPNDEFLFQLQYSMYESAMGVVDIHIIEVIGTNLTIFLLVLDDGTIKLIMSDGITTVNNISAAGALSLDGAIHGIQASFRIAGAAILYQVLVDDVTILNGGAGFGTIFTTMDSFKLFNYYNNPTIPTAVSRCAEVIVNNSSTPGSYPAATASTVDITFCNNKFGTPTITDISIICNSHTIVVNGNGFVDGGIITVTKDNIVIPFTLLSLTSTVIMLDVPTFSNGAWCVDVVNP